MPIEQLRRIIGLSEPEAVRLVDRLVAEGLVRRRQSPSSAFIDIFQTARLSLMVRPIGFLLLSITDEPVHLLRD